MQDGSYEALFNMLLPSHFDRVLLNDRNSGMEVSYHFCNCPSASFGEDWSEQKGIKTLPRSLYP